MTHLVDTRAIYRRHAEACLAVLAKTNNPASQAMLTAMAHTWLRLAEARIVTDNAQQYRRNADEALHRVSRAKPEVQGLWLQLAESWLHLLQADQKPEPSNTSSTMESPAAEGRHSWH
jgi:hypothetical protein